ncbi:CHAD domain-containing protein [Tolumonas lignilytica]|uniref:CHAD domain-containing protein n=1 Tax=Tolumonas lignilytica TaxID=1283284 RepID=UPI0004676281|nr:CHAD domain-containing protein [Tolumonas lignilytica]
MKKRNKKKKVHINSFAQKLSHHFCELSEWASQALMHLTDPDEPEALHDLRVSLRSMRVLLQLSACHKALSKYRKQLGVIAKLTGDERDLEVVLRLAESLLAETGKGTEQIVFLTEHLLQSQTKLQSELQRVDLKVQLADVAQAWTKQIGHKQKCILQSAARTRLKNLERQLTMAAENVQLTSPIDEWHALRLLVKKLRYWCEGFSAVLTSHQAGRLPLLIQLQQRLGLLHDYYLLATPSDQRIPLPVEWQETLDKWQRHTLYEAANLLQQIKMTWNS